MEMEFREGFTVYKNGKGPVYIVLHSGPDLGEFGQPRDIGADKVANLCWKKTGGSLVLSTMPRSRRTGIDMNRASPDIREAIRGIGKMDASYMNKYGWWAHDRNDYANRLIIYRNFWRTVKSLGKGFLLLHTLTCRLANFPSIIDIVTFDSRGYDKERIIEIAGRLNKKHAGFFRKIGNTYKECTLFENRMLIKETVSKRKNWIEEELFKKELKVIERFSDKSIAGDMHKNLTSRTFLAAAESALKRGGDPRITVEEKFSGKKAFGPRKNLLQGKNIALEIEVNSFLSSYYAERARDIILDIERLL